MKYISISQWKWRRAYTYKRITNISIIFSLLFFASIQWLHILLYQIIHCHHSNFQIHYYCYYCAMIIIALLLFTSGAHFMISIYICVASVKLSVKKIKFSIFFFKRKKLKKKQFLKIFQILLIFNSPKRHWFYFSVRTAVSPI